MMDKHKLKIMLISAALPPQLDGIGDYTAQLAKELAHTVDAIVITCEGHSHLPLSDVKIVPAFLPDTPGSCVRLVPIIQSEAPDWIILQYNPFAYGKWGFNLHLPKVMKHIKKQMPHIRLAVMVHEPFVPIITWKFAVMATWQRWQLWQLGRAADVLFFSIDPWAQRFRRWFPHKPVHHLPVGSNIPLIAITREEARQRLGIADKTLVLGLFGTAHISRLFLLVRGAAKAVERTGREVVVLYIGPDEHVVRNALGNIRLLTEGFLPAEEVSRRLSAVDVYIVPFEDGISTRRTTLMAGLQHGLAIVGTQGYNTDSILQRENGRAFLLADTADDNDFYTQTLRLINDPALRTRLGCEAQHLYQNKFAWKPIIAHLLDALSVPQQNK